MLQMDNVLQKSRLTLLQHTQKSCLHNLLLAASSPTTLQLFFLQLILCTLSGGLLPISRVENGKKKECLREKFKPSLPSPLCTPGQSLHNHAWLSGCHVRTDPWSVFGSRFSDAVRPLLSMLHMRVCVCVKLLEFPALAYVGESVRLKMRSHSTSCLRTLK